MKKKVLSVLLTAALIASVSSCGNGSTAPAATAAGEKNSAETYAAEAEGTYPAATTVAPSFAADYEAGEYEYADSYDGMSDGYKDDGGYMGYHEKERQAGLLSGGEWRDNSNYTFWNKLFEQREDWAEAESDWKISTRDRYFVRLSDANGTPAAGMTVKLSANKTIIWETVSDSRGEAFLFAGIDPDAKLKPDEIIAEFADGRAVVTKITDDMLGSAAVIEIAVPEASPMRTELDLMLMVDTTGSMGDELKYLQTELGDVIGRVTDATNADVQLSVNFYRDEGDDYVVRDFGFTKNISIAIDHLKDQRSNGGGDYPEAVISALDNAFNGHQWRDKSEKIMLLVLDAPPHIDEGLQNLKQLVQQAAKLGIRIIPVASSGVDTQTEFLCRCMAMATGGTYTFLTDDSGVGNSHLEPTIGSYTIEKLNDMLVRLISDYFSQEARTYAEPYDGGNDDGQTTTSGTPEDPDDNYAWYPASHEKSSACFEDGLYTEGLIKSDNEFAEFYQKYLGDDMLDGLYSESIDFSKDMVAYKVEMLTSGSITVDDSKGVYCRIDGDRPVFRYTLIYPEVGTCDIMTLFVYSVIPTDGSGAVAITTAVTGGSGDEWLDRMELVDNEIESFMSETSDMSVKDRAQAAIKLLVRLADEGLVVRQSIGYDGDEMVAFAYDIGGGETVLGGMDLSGRDPMMN
jgi:hypothetical protein